MTVRKSIFTWILIWAVLIIVFFVASLVFFKLDIMGDEKLASVTVESSAGKTKYVCAVADLLVEQTEGLMHRKVLCDYCGMLFIYNESHTLDFWMKNMVIPIDIVFLDQDKRILNIYSDVPVCTTENCTLYTSDGPAQYVLEIPANSSVKHGFAKGDLVNIDEDG